MVDAMNDKDFNKNAVLLKVEKDRQLVRDLEKERDCLNASLKEQARNIGELVDVQVTLQARLGLLSVELPEAEIDHDDDKICTSKLQSMRNDAAKTQADLKVIETKLVGRRSRQSAIDDNLKVLNASLDSKYSALRMEYASLLYEDAIRKALPSLCVALGYARISTGVTPDPTKVVEYAYMRLGLPEKSHLIGIGVQEVNGEFRDWLENPEDRLL